MTGQPDGLFARRHGRAAFGFIFVTVALDMLALGIIIPVLPKLIIEFEGGDTARAAVIYGLFATVWAAMQFVGAPLLGAISDRFGRRRVILISTLGLGLDYIVMALAPTLGWLFAGRVVSGLTSASFATGYAYVADVTAEEKRAGKFGLLGAAFGLGFILGPAIGGLAGGIHLRLPFWIAGGLSLAGTAYGWLVLPESLPPERRSPFNWARANPLGALRFLHGHGALFGLATAAFLYRVAHDIMPSLFVIYTDHRYQWSERTVGLVLALVGVTSMIVQGGLVGRVVKRFGERRALTVGFSLGAVAFVIYGAAVTGPIFLVGIPFSALFGLSYPSLQGLMTRRVGAAEQGQLQGAVASLMGIAGIMAPLFFTQAFDIAVGPGRPAMLAGVPFFLAAGVLVAALWIALRATRPGVTG